ncbi:hypothetical protein IH824_04545 [candidate division KSB1 bacterium]|nr:hypothetical protein [candidate division KSB1 bacterium]
MRFNSISIHIFPKLALLILLLSCTDRERSNPLDLKNPETLGRPTGLNVISIQDTIFLNWDIIELSDLTGYQIYRESDTNTEPVLHAFVSSPSNTFKDFTVVFDIEYDYQISAVGDNFESSRSDFAKITPGPTFNWVTENGNQQIAKLTHDSRHLIHRTGRFSAIVDIEPNPRTGEVWVLNNFIGIEGNLKKVTPEGRVDERFITFESPTDAALNYDLNEIWVADPQQSSVTKLDSIGNTIFTIHEFTIPTLVAVDQRNGNCWVAHNDSVSRVLSDGTQVLKSGVRFDSITSMDLNSEDGSVWLVDGTRIVKINQNGDFLLEIKAPLTFPGKIAINDSTGELWAINDNPAGLYKFSPTGEMLFDVTVSFSPDNISVNLYDNSVLVSDVRGHTIYRVSEGGEILSLFKGLIFPDLVSVQNQARTN